MKELVAATTNKDKVKEIKNILKGLGIKVLTPDKFGAPPGIVEDGRTFEDNASKKARIISRLPASSRLRMIPGLWWAL